jgi:hypothetical protein
MTDEKLMFRDMLQNIVVIDSNDKVKKLADCVEAEFDELVSKITEYNQDGEILIKLKLKCDKKTKHGIDIYGEVSKKCPRGIPKNSLYRDARTNGLYFEDPDQMKLFKPKVTEINAKNAKNADEG